MAFKNIAAPIAFGSPNMDFSNPSASYNSAYQNAASINQQLYGNYMSGMSTLGNNYSSLSNDVLNRLRGGNKANLQDIANKYSAMSGQMSQQMIDRGLGNTTVQQSMQRGIASDRAQESTRSRNMYSGLMAQYQSQIGQAQLAAQGHGLDMLLSQVSAPYPDAGMYAQLAQMQAAGQMPGSLPAMPGASAPYAPVGGIRPPSYGGAGYGTNYGPEGAPNDQWMGYGALNTPAPGYGGYAAYNAYGSSGGYSPGYTDVGMGAQVPTYSLATGGGGDF